MTLIVVENNQHDLSFSISSLKPIVASVLSLEKKKAKSVSIYFVSRQKICALHKKFFNDPTLTDCISFPSGQEDDLGEIFVCPWTAKAYVNKHGGDVYEEVTLYIVHALLHLLGYDDIGPKEKTMRMAEKRHMKALLLKGRILKR